MTPIAFIVTNHVHAGMEDEYRRLCEPVIDRMRHEPMFVNTALHQSAEDPSLFMLYETWADEADFFKVQLKKDYRVSYESALERLLRSSRVIKPFKLLRSDFTFFTPGESKSSVVPQR